MTLDDARLFVEDRCVVNGNALGIAGHCDLHFQIAAPDHPCQQFERLAGLGIRWCQRKFDQPLFDLRADFFTVPDGFDFRWIERAPND